MMRQKLKFEGLFSSVHLTLEELDGFLIVIP